MAYEIDYDEDGRPEEVYVKEEPDCYTCCDTGTVSVNAAGEMVPWTPETGEANCPECSPTEAQMNAQQAELAARVASGEAGLDDEAPF